MKNVLILSSGDCLIFDAIIKYFKNRNDILFTLLCNEKNAKIIKKAQKLNIETYIIENKDLQNFFHFKNYDIVVLANFNQILNKEILKTNTFINIHPSLLPKHKTKNAIKRSFINKDPKAGITIYYLSEKIYEGEIIYQKEINTNPKWNIKKFEKELYKQIVYYYPKIIEKLLKINVLILGSNAKEHAIADNFLKSKLLNKLYLADCNDGFSYLGENINYLDYDDLAKIILEKNINLVVVNNEEYLSNGLIDIIKKYNINTIGADKKTAKIESSKYFAKKLMQKYEIKTASCKKITNKKDINEFIKYFKNPIIKADGITFGKGIFESEDIEKTKRELYKFLDGKYLKASKTTLIEQKLSGYRATLYTFWDGENTLHFPLCQNYKKSLLGFHCAGVGAICPLMLDENNEKKLDKYKEKINALLKEEKITTPFILCSELIVCNDDIYTLDFHTIFQDPDTQVLLNYIKNDWLEIFYDASSKMINNINLIEANKEITAIMMTSKGYPLNSRKNIEIKNIENVNNFIKVYFSNIINKDGRIISDGGRVLSVVSEDRNAILRYLKQIEYKEKEYRNDIILRKK